MKSILIFVSGLVVFGLTFAAWVYLSALACGMNTTGCPDFQMDWTDWDTLQFFAPTFIIGAALMGWGAWLWMKTKNRS